MGKFETAAHKNQGMYVSVIYSLSKWFENHDIDNALDKIARRYGGSDFGSGAGFGERDNSYGFTERKQANKFISGVKAYGKKVKIHIKFETTSLYEYFNIENKLEDACIKLEKVAKMNTKNGDDELCADFSKKGCSLKTMSDSGKKDDLFADRIYTFLKQHRIKYSQGLQHRVFGMTVENLLKVNAIK